MKHITKKFNGLGCSVTRKGMSVKTAAKAARFDAKGRTERSTRDSMQYTARVRAPRNDAMRPMHEFCEVAL